MSDYTKEQIENACIEFTENCEMVLLDKNSDVMTFDSNEELINAFSINKENQNRLECKKFELKIIMDELKDNQLIPKDDMYKADEAIILLFEIQMFDTSNGVYKLIEESEDNLFSENAYISEETSIPDKWFERFTPDNVTVDDICDWDDTTRKETYMNILNFIKEQYNF